MRRNSAIVQMCSRKRVPTLLLCDHRFTCYISILRNSVENFVSALTIHFNPHDNYLFRYTSSYLNTSASKCSSHQNFSQLKTIPSQHKFPFETPSNEAPKSLQNPRVRANIIRTGICFLQMFIHPGRLLDRHNPPKGTPLMLSVCLDSVPG